MLGQLAKTLLFSRSAVKSLHIALLGLLAISAFGCRAEAVGDGLSVRPTDEGTDFAPNAGPAAFTNWSEMPATVGGQYRMFTSYDRDDDSSYPLLDHGNKDFNNFLAVCDVDLSIALEKDDAASCAPSLKGYLVAADDNGPGIVSRLLFAVGTVDPLSGADVTFDEERVRIYVDDLTAPVYDGRLSEWRNGTAPPFVSPFTTWTSGSLVSYRPISYQSKVRILLDNLSRTSAYYHRVELLSGTVPSNFGVGARSASDVARALDGFREQARAATDKTTLSSTAFDLPEGQSSPFIDVTGPATIDVLRLTVDTGDAAELRALSVHLTWDDQTTSAIDLPLADLFGAHQALTSFDTIPMTVRVDGGQTEMTLSLPMPFRTRARLALTNQAGRSFRVSAELLGRSGATVGDWGYLHATWAERTSDFRANERYVVTDVQGRGKYVGTLMYVEGRADDDATTPSPYNFLEGDDRTIVDGTTSRGTGTEDVFDGGWYFIDGRYDRPFSALLAKTSNEDAETGAVTMLRWNVLANAIPFRESFSLDFEVGANRPQTAIAYRSVAFYYLQ